VSAPSLIVAEQVSKQFHIHHNRAYTLKARLLSTVHARYRPRIEEFWALRDIDLRVARGESVGLVGRNGSGKSTLLKMIAGIHRPTSGRILIRRGLRLGTMIELGVGFHPELSGRENVFLNASVYGLTRADVERIYDAVVDYSEIGRFIDEPIKNYSSGMMMRLAFSVAAHLDPEVLLLDEIFAVGDEAFQQKCRQTMQRLIGAGRTVVFVSHSAQTVREVCQRVCVLSNGRKVFDGPTDEGLDYYHALMSPEPAVLPADAPPASA
jgi:ABC-2 type transport system ATP-binding protein